MANHQRAVTPDPRNTTDSELSDPRTAMMLKLSNYRYLLMALMRTVWLGV